MEKDYGWFSIHRKLLESDRWLAEPFTHGQAWIDLIGLARHKDGFVKLKNNRIDLKRGQLCWSMKSLSKRWKWSRGKVDRFLKELETDTQIEQLKSHVTSIITIVNYDQYQDNRATDRATDGQPTGQQTGINNNGNNDNNGDNPLPRNVYTIVESKFGPLPQTQMHDVMAYNSKVEDLDKFEKCFNSLFDETESKFRSPLSMTQKAFAEYGNSKSKPKTKFASLPEEE